MSTSKPLGILVYGATGYTGRLVCEYLNRRYGSDGEISWGMAGRSQSKLEQVRDELGVDSTIPLVVADAGDAQSVSALVNVAQVVITTVGPYQHYGSELVGACAESGTDYVDLCGEPTWMAQMLAEHGDAAKASGARIVFSCGFDSIPFDMGVWFLQQQAQQRFGAPMSRVKGRVRSMKGTFSGGTLASFNATVAAAGEQPELFNLLINPFALTPGFTGPAQPTGHEPVFDDDLNSWSAPFVMATINTKNIHRSNYLLDHAYGSDFVYDEMLLTGPGEQGEAFAKAAAADDSMAKNKRQPGEGPSAEERESGSYELLFAGSDAKGNSLAACVKGDKDPGYGSTSKMIAEAAVCLLLNPDTPVRGISTPAAAMGELLLPRLQDNAGLSFEIES